MSSGTIVKLNIGGTVFQTWKSTLTKYGGFFKTVLETNVQLPRDDAGCIFIDRSPKHFDLILNFLRDGDVALPNTEKEIQEILKEAQVYHLTGLVTLCNAKTPSDILVKFRVIENDNQMIQVITNPKKPVLIIYYKVEAWEKETFPLNVEYFEQKYKTSLDIYFSPAKNDSSHPFHFSLYSKNRKRWTTPTIGQKLLCAYSLEETIQIFFNELE